MTKRNVAWYPNQKGDMVMKKLLYFFLLPCCLFSLILFQGCAAKKPYLKVTLPADDASYVYDLAKDTWRCIDYYVAPETGFPYDSDTKPDGTNTTNIALYMTSVVAAHELGFIKEAEAVAKIKKILDSVEKLENWNGFLNNWINVKGETKAYAGDNYISDFNKLPAALLVVRQEFPQLYGQCSRIFAKIDWSMFYDPATGNCYSSYDIVNKKLGGSLGYLASDTNLASFFMIAAGRAPAQTWQKLNRETITQYDVTFYKPGWNWGGLFMSAMSGIYTDERKTQLGKSTADFAYVQMLYAKEKNLPAWGWSNCFIPGNGYTEGGFLPTNVVTPHASALAVIYYPHKAVENLKKLESMGARKSFKINNEDYNFGFCDAINIKTGKTTSKPIYLTSLDQTMLFLSLANYLKDGVIWRLFEKDPVVKNGKELLKDYFDVDNDYLEIYAQRDETSLKELGFPAPSEPSSALLVDNFDSGKEMNNLGGKIGLWKLDANGPYQGCAPEYDAETKISESGYGLKLTYDVDTKGRAFCAYTQDLGNKDLRRFNCLSFYIKGDAEKGFTRRLKIELWDSNDVEIIYFVQGISDRWQKIVIPFDEFKGILSRWDSVRKLAFVFENPPDFYKSMGITDKKGVIYLDDLAFEYIK